MLCYARLEIESKNAENVARALMVDDPNWCKCKTEGGKLVIEIKTKKLTSLLYAIDEYLMHIKMCENI